MTGHDVVGGRVVGDRGAATVLGAVVIAALLLIASLVMAVGAAETTRHRAASAADLAALAAAAAASGGADHDSACARARWVTTNMAVHLDSCRFDEADALVEVSVEPGGPLSGRGRVHARARAGPVQLVADGRPVRRPFVPASARATVIPAR